MKTLRWKPLRSSVRQARAITGFLELVSGGVVLLSILIGFITLGIGGGGGASFLIAFLIVIVGVVLYFILKMGYILLELVTEIADDTRLQLLAVAGDEYDRMVAKDKLHQQNNYIEPDAILPNLDNPELYNAAVKGYVRGGGMRKCNFENSSLSQKKVVLRDDNNEIVQVMEFYDGQWLKQ